MSDVHEWFGIGATGAPLVAHALRPLDEFDAPGPRLSRLSLCFQERRRTWQPVAEFALPEAFTRCPRCEQLVREEEETGG